MGDNAGAHGSFRQVEDWLRSMGLICYAQSFYDNGYENVDICRQIAEQDLAVIGISNVKDKNDILAGVCRLKQKAVYFELEPEEDESTSDVPRKYDPFLLITRVKAELENDNVQLTEPPFFYPDGSLGSLDSLAETLSFKLETFVEDVREALDQLRRRQLPAGLYNDVNEMMEMQRQQEVKQHISGTLTGPPKPKRESLEEPKAYLNVETPFRRTTSLSKHDKRITKSTTNLADIDFGDDKPFGLGANKKGKKSKTVVKSNSSREKSRHLFGLSIRKKSTADRKANIVNESFVAKDLTMNQEEIIDLMTKVKHGKLSQDKVVAHATLNYRKSLCGDFSQAKNLEKHQLKKKEKKKLEKEERNRKKVERGKPTGHSLFYTSEVNDNADTLSLVSDAISEGGQMEDVVSLCHSSGSDVSRESPDLRSFGERALKGKDDNGTVSSPGENSLHSSTGSLNSQSGTPVVMEQRIKSRSNSVRSVTKPTKQPPPIPIRLDQLSSQSQNQVKNTQEQLNGAVVTSRIDRIPLKPTFSVPHSNGSHPIRTSETSAPKSQEFTTKEHCINANDDSLVKGKTLSVFPLALKDLEEVKLKPLGFRHSLVETTYAEVMKGDAKTSTSNDAAKVSDRLDDKNHSGIVPPSQQLNANAAEKRSACQLKGIHSKNESIVHEKTELSYKPMEIKKPVPPPRSMEKNTEKRPLIPPRKRRSVSCEVGDAGTVGRDLTEDKSGTSYSIPGAYKPMPKPKPPLPPHRTELRDVNETKKYSEGKESGVKDVNLVPNEREEDSWKTEKEKLKTFSTKFHSRSLTQLIEMKCSKEGVVLSEFPYTSQDGSWNVPRLLTERYAEELCLPMEQVVGAMDFVRNEMAVKRGETVKPAVIKEVMDAPGCDPVAKSLKSWLISKGLPMFIKDFTECGLQSMEDLHFLTKQDILSTGVFDNSHVHQLLTYLE